MKRFAAMFLCVILLLSFAACEQDEPSNANKSFQYHLAAEPETLDPQIAADESGIILIQALFEGLTRLDADGNAVPGVAESWTSNADFTQFTFQLREDAVWNDDDNTPVTADDFVYAFQRALDPATNSTTCIPQKIFMTKKNRNGGQKDEQRSQVLYLQALRKYCRVDSQCGCAAGLLWREDERVGSQYHGGRNGKASAGGRDGREYCQSQRGKR